MALLTFVTGHPEDDYVRVGHNSPPTINNDAVWSLTLGAGITTDISVTLSWDNTGPDPDTGWSAKYEYAFALSTNGSDQRTAHLENSSERLVVKHLDKVKKELSGTRGTTTILFTNLNLSAGTYYVRANFQGDTYRTMKAFQKAGNTYTPTTLAASAISAVTSSVPADGSTQGTVSIQRYYASYTHDVTITLGSRSQTFTNVGTSLTFTIPSAWQDQITSATSRTATVSVQTKNGSTNIGSPVTASFTVTVPDAAKPTVSITSVSPTGDNATVNGWGVYVQGLSKAAIVVAATAAAGSTISAYSYKVGNLAASSSSSNSYTSEVITQTGNVTITVTVTDSRGRSATATTTITVYAYAKPAISAATVYRCLQDGTIDTNGTYGKGRMVFSFSDVNGNNSLTLSRIRWNNGSTWTNVTTSAVSNTYYTFGGGAISISSSYTVQFTITDAVGNSVTVSRTIQVAAVPFNIKPNGLGMGIGKYAETDDTLEIAWKADFKGDVVGVSQAGTWTYFIESGQSTSNWGDYEAGVTPAVKRWGPFVHLSGAVTPKSITTLNANTPVQIGSIPAAFAPSRQQRFLCQASGTAIFCLTVSAAGSVFISRYRDIGNANGQYTDAEPGNWFPFSVSWLI